MITGKKVVSGIAVGQVFVLKEQELLIEDGLCASIEKEIERLSLAFEKAREELREIYSKVNESIGSDEAEIIEAHLMMLDDPEFIEAIHEKINGLSQFATRALHVTTEEMVAVFESMNNEYMKLRSHDVKDISRRVMQCLNGFTDKIDLPDDCILVAQELKPSVLSSIDHDKIIGILTSVDGRNSHTAILARSLEIPTLMGVSGIHQKVETGDTIAFSAEDEKIYLSPDPEELFKVEQARVEWLRRKVDLLELKGTTSFFNGEKVSLEANINSLSELKLALKYGSEGIGLFRTEFIYMDRATAPNEEEQYTIYSEVLSALHPKPCTIRTLDVGGDKEIPYLNIEKEENPFLGVRAIRYCLKHPAFFKVQLRALLRASAHGNLKIMIPMVTTLQEVRETKKLLADVEQELKSQQVEIGTYQLGIMIEVPASAVMAEEFAKEVDFFSIGTNDLTQYTLAVDRMNEGIRNLYDSAHPAVMRLIEMTVAAARKEKIGVSVCGEMAGQTKHIKALLGLGLRSLSMTPSQILSVRKLLL